ncbi:MAG TPA: flavodoxin domain-containing protein [Aggregatilineales bacterium]|nr:flavodoxin domain-containing protein [Aggregatilineales bacterium]
MTPNILVLYATRTGGTAPVAEAIASTLQSDELNVDVGPIRELTDISKYDAAILGSSIRVGSWLPEMVDFMKDNLSRLQNMPVAFFTVCLTLSEDTQENRETVRHYLDPVRQLVNPVTEGYFAGKMDYARLSLPVRWMVKKMKAPEGDYRDWNKIRKWATDLKPFLVGNLILPR